MTDELDISRSSRKKSRQAIAVVTNKSWSEGFVPLFVYFAQRAYPDTQTLVFTIGSIDPLVATTLERLGCDPARYRLIEGFGTDFGQSPLAAKTARWVVPLEREAMGYDALYIGDIDILLALDPVQDIFEHHSAHCRKLGIPISNMVRAGGDRVTGLHFVQLSAYLAKAESPLRSLRTFLTAASCEGDRLSTRYPNPGGDEKALYEVIDKADPAWIDVLRKSEFRPHHGVHLGLFRNQGRIGDALLKALRDRDQDMLRYWDDVSTELDRTIASGLWSDLFASYPRVETSCQQFLSFYRDWRASAGRASDDAVWSSPESGPS